MKFILSVFVIFSFLFSSLQEAQANTFPKDSIYQMDAEWRNPDNQISPLKSFAGQHVIIGMVYTKCPHACPMTISKIQKIESEIQKLGIKDYKIILASFDVKRDTPAHLKEYTKTRNLNDKWVFLSSTKEATARELSVVLGISYKELDDGEFAHSNVISLLDKKGVVIAKVENLSSDHAPILNALKAAKK